MRIIYVYLLILHLKNVKYLSRTPLKLSAFLSRKKLDFINFFNINFYI